MQLADDAAYHVMARGHNRETIFHNDQDLQAFRDLLARYQKRFDFQLYHDCVMSNHVHLLLRPLHRAQSAGGEDGGSAVGLPLVELSGLPAGPAESVVGRESLRLHEQGVFVRNQAVLLRGGNDDAAVLRSVPIGTSRPAHASRRSDAS